LLEIRLVPALAKAEALPGPKPLMGWRSFTKLESICRKAEKSNTALLSKVRLSMARPGGESVVVLASNNSFGRIEYPRDTDNVWNRPQPYWLPGDERVSPERGRPTARRSGAILEEQRRFKKDELLRPGML
jgi:hypothetical protein